MAARDHRRVSRESKQLKCPIKENATHVVGVLRVEPSKSVELVLALQMRKPGAEGHLERHMLNLSKLNLAYKLGGHNEKVKPVMAAQSILELNIFDNTLKSY